MEEASSSTILEGEITGIKFGLATHQEICTASISNCAISHASQLSNPFLGLPLEFGKCESCGTSEAGKCEGHFGYIELPIPIFHPNHVSELKRMLSLLCLKCLKMKKNKFPTKNAGLAERMLSSCCEDASQVSIGEIKPTDGSCSLQLKRPSKSRTPPGFWNFLERYGFRYGDGHIRTLLPCEVMEMLKRIPQETRKKLAAKGYFPQDGYILSQIPVPPNCLSVPEISDGVSVMSAAHIPLSIQHLGDLQHGKTNPHVVEHRENLYVLSVLTGEGFEMFDPKYDKWVTLPETPFFHRRYRGHHTDSVVVGSNIFVSCLSSIYRFDMADSRQIWKEHSFTNCTALPYGWDEKTLALEMSDGDWLIFTCFPELSYDPHEIKDNPCCDDYDCNNSNMDDYLPYRHQLVPDRHFEWHGTSLPAYIMSKDFTSLTPIQPLRLPDDLLPNQPGCERLRDLYMAKPREIDYRIVHLGGQEICLVLSIDTGFEPNGRVLFSQIQKPFFCGDQANHPFHIQCSS